MGVMLWEEKYSVGIVKIDDQHKKLIDLVNKLYDAMKEGKGKDTISEVLEETVEYTRYHFGTEEEMFKKYKYSRTEEHVKEHKEFKDKVSSLLGDVQAGKANVSIEVFHYLSDWIYNHILYTDMKYKKDLADL